jgi:ribosomal protein L7/L12
MIRLKDNWTVLNAVQRIRELIEEVPYVNREQVMSLLFEVDVPTCNHTPNKIATIKVIRQLTRLDLRGSKEMSETIGFPQVSIETSNEVTRVFDALRQRGDV